MLGFAPEAVSSLYEHLGSELDLFAIPLAVLSLGLGLSVLSSCVSHSKTTLLSRLDEPKELAVTATTLTPTSSAATEEALSEYEDAEDAEELPADRLVSMMALEGRCGQTPPGRIGGSADFDPAAGIFIVAGGMAEDAVTADINIYSVDEKKWVEFKSAAAGYGFLYGHMAMLEESVVEFGGIGEDGLPRDTLQIYNFDLMTWEPLPLLLLGEPSPCARFNGAVSVLDRGRMILCGGRDAAGRCLNDVWMLELIGFRAVWTKLYAGKSCEEAGEEEYVFEPREALSSAVVGSKLFVFGGSTAEGDILNTGGGLVEVFDLETCQWSLLDSRGRGPQVLCSGGSAHALPSVNKIFVVSGEESEKSFFNGLYVLDVSSVVNEGGDGVPEWSAHGVQWYGDLCMPPDPRLFYAAALDTAEGDLYVFGGQVMGPDGEEAEIEKSVAVLDLSDIMQLLPPPVEEDYSGSEEKGITEEEATDENEAKRNVNMGPLFADLKESDAKKIVAVEEETLEDFEQVKGEIDLAFASKYATEDELTVMKKRLLEAENVMGGSSEQLQCSYPLPKKKQ